MATLQDHTIVMHPGPMVRGMEITADVADSDRSVIVEQVTNGVAVRMAVLYLLLGGTEPAIVERTDATRSRRVTELPDQGRPDPRRRADRPAARGRRDRRGRHRADAATAPRSSTPTGWSRCPAWSTCTPTCASPAARTPRPSRPAPRPRRWAASPPCTRWPTPTRSPTPPASSSRSGGSAARPGYCDVYPVGAVTVGLAGERLAELGAMADSAARVRVFSDDGKCVSDAVLMRRALEYVKAFDGVVAQHAQEPRLTEDAQMNEGELSGRLGLRGWPAVAEEAIIARDCLLAAHVGSRLHVCHVSTAGSVEIVRWAKGKGWNVTAEVCPHHLLLTDELAATYDPIYKVNPPLRSAADVEALRAGLADGTIDVVATDHAPHPHEDKDCEWAGRRVRDARPGDRAVGRAADDGRHRAARLGRGRRADVRRARRGSAGSPTTAARSRSGEPGQPGALRPVASRRVVDAAEPASLSRNTPYAGTELPGRVVATFLRGKPTVLDGKLAVTSTR